MNFFVLKKGALIPWKNIIFNYIDSLDLWIFYAAISHLVALNCLLCSCGVMISKDVLTLSIANIMLRTLCETVPIATSFGFDSYFLR